MNRLLPALLGTVVGCTAAWALGQHLGPSFGPTRDASAYEVDDDEVPVAVPYRGRLEKDGVAVSAATSVRFVLRIETNAIVWTEDHTVDPDDSGRFEVLLGSNDPDALREVIEYGDELTLELWVMDDGVLEALVGTQRFTMTAYALWTQASGNLAIGGTLTAGGALSVTGDIVSQGATANTHPTSVVKLGIDRSGNEVSGRYGVAFGDDSAASPAGVQLVYSASANTLALEQAVDMSDASDLWSISQAGALHVYGPTTAGAGLLVDGPLTIENGADLEVKNGSLMIGSNTDGQSTRTLSLDGGDVDFNWVYSTSSDTLALNAVTNGVTAVAFQLTSAGVGKTAYTLKVNDGKELVIESRLTSSTLDDPDEIDLNAANKRYYGDSGCELGTIQPSYRTDDSNSAMICFCLGSTNGGDGQGQGWYCLE